MTLVTGGGTGLGKAAARELAACGGVAEVVAAAGARDPATPVRPRLVGNEFLLEG